MRDSVMDARSAHGVGRADRHERGPVRPGGRKRAGIGSATVALTALLTLAPAIADPAEAVTPRTVEYQLGPLISRSTLLNYGSARGDSIPIGTSTTRVVIETTESAIDGKLRGDVRCRIYGVHSPSVDQPFDNTPLGGEVTRDWTAAEWSDPASRYLDLPAGVIALWPGGDPDDYDRFDLFCASSQAPVQRQISRLLWRLTPYEGGPESVTLTQDPAALWVSESQETYTDSAPPQIIGSGDLVRLTGPSGTWSPGQGVDVRLLADVADPVASVSDDGSMTSFRMPQVTVDDGRRPVPVIFSGTTTVTRGPTILQTTVAWTTNATLREGDARASSTALSLSAKYGLSVQRLVASVTVGTSGSPASGSVAILVDGSRVATASLDANGSAQVRLPTIARGAHRLTAQYLGDSVTDGSVSPGVWFRIVV